MCDLCLKAPRNNSIDKDIARFMFSLSAHHLLRPLVHENNFSERESVQLTERLIKFPIWIIQIL